MSAVASKPCRQALSLGQAAAPSRACRVLRPVGSKRPELRRRAADTDAAMGQVDLETEVERFMRLQAEMESGAAFARTKDTDQVIGGDIINEEDAKAYARGVVEMLRSLKVNRDMSVNECRLVVSIEDPRARERRDFDVEDDRGVSRDEMAAALLDVAEGRLPRDRLALKCLYEDMQSWPFLNETPTTSNGDTKGTTHLAAAMAEAQADYSGLADAGLADSSEIAKPYIMGKEARAGDKPQTLEDLLPSWVGYLTLYGVSAIPVAIGALVLVLLWNSQFH